MIRFDKFAEPLGFSSGFRKYSISNISADGWSLFERMVFDQLQGRQQHSPVLFG
jgi:hypothetical protein